MTAVAEDPRVRKIMELREARKAEAPARPRVAGIVRCPACASAVGPDGVCRSCRPDAPAVPGKAPRMRRADKPMGRCPSCGHVLSTFSGECHHCAEPVPTSYDLRPVRRVEPPAWEEEGPPPAAPTPVAAAEASGPPPGTNGIGHTARNAGRPCRTCGKPTNGANGRCYACRPGGWKPGGVGREPKRSAPREKAPAPAPAPAPVTAPVTPAARAGGPVTDTELAAIAGCVGLLAGLDAGQLARALGYLTARFGAEGGGR